MTLHPEPDYRSWQSAGLRYVVVIGFVTAPIVLRGIGLYTLPPLLMETGIVQLIEAVYTILVIALVCEAVRYWPEFSSPRK
jgi:uncharacterized membrane protein YhfC